MFIEKESEVSKMYFVKLYVKFYWEICPKEFIFNKVGEKSIMYLNK